MNWRKSFDCYMRAEIYGKIVYVPVKLICYDSTRPNILFYYNGEYESNLCCTKQYILEDWKHIPVELLTEQGEHYNFTFEELLFKDKNGIIPYKIPDTLPYFKTRL